ncbi:hypothetical protein [Haloarchaeobius amylolyticus]|uniref:hypothetical protein n=1 Tax=Haloarchaeobius amylolyticus TaxID=1198296 RepID=UPI002271DB58|nr:hypothetical protein [Haloarchaeobius amylolyticus]
MTAGNITDPVAALFVELTGETTITERQVVTSNEGLSDDLTADLKAAVENGLADTLPTPEED